MFTLKLRREVPGIALVVTLALTQCGPDPEKDESGDDGVSAAGGLDDEGGDTASGGSSRGGSDDIGGAGAAGEGDGGTNARGGQGGASGTDAGGSGPAGGSGGNDVNGGDAGVANGGSSMNGGSAGNGGSLGTGGAVGGASGAGGTPAGGQSGSAGGGRAGSSGTSGTSSGGSTSGAGGSGGTTVWMPCTNPRDPLYPGATNGNSGSFMTAEAVCYVLPTGFNNWACANMGNRMVQVNGVAVSCNPYGTWPLPPAVNGYYYFEFSAGTPDYASFYWWVG